MSWLRSLFCEHEWEPYGGGMDSYVRCSKCGKIKEESPGDLAPW